MTAGWRVLAVFLLMAASAVTGYLRGALHEQLVADAAASRVQLQHTTELGRINTASRTALQAATDRARTAETKAATDMAALDLKKTKELTDAKNRYATDLAGLRSGAIRVRDNFACAGDAGARGGASASSAAPGVGDATPRGGLQTADAEFLLRVGAEADEVAVQLQACQAIVIQDRAGASGVPQP